MLKTKLLQLLTKLRTVWTIFMHHFAVYVVRRVYRRFWRWFRSNRDPLRQKLFRVLVINTAAGAIRLYATFVFLYPSFRWATAFSERSRLLLAKLRQLSSPNLDARRRYLDIREFAKLPQDDVMAESLVIGPDLIPWQIERMRFGQIPFPVEGTQLTQKGYFNPRFDLAKFFELSDPRTLARLDEYSLGKIPSKCRPLVGLANEEFLIQDGERASVVDFLPFFLYYLTPETFTFDNLTDHAIRKKTWFEFLQKGIVFGEEESGNLISSQIILALYLQGQDLLGFLGLLSPKPLGPISADVGLLLAETADMEPVWSTDLRLNTDAWRWHNVQQLSDQSVGYATLMHGLILEDMDYTVGGAFFEKHWVSSQGRQSARVLFPVLPNRTVSLRLLERTALVHHAFGQLAQLGIFYALGGSLAVSRDRWGRWVHLSGIRFGTREWAQDSEFYTTQAFRRSRTRTYDEWVYSYGEPIISLGHGRAHHLHFAGDRFLKSWPHYYPDHLEYGTQALDGRFLYESVLRDLAQPRRWAALKTQVRVLLGILDADCGPMLRRSLALDEQTGPAIEKLLNQLRLGLGLSEEPTDTAVSVARNYSARGAHSTLLQGWSNGFFDTLQGTMEFWLNRTWRAQTEVSIFADPLTPSSHLDGRLAPFERDFATPDTMMVMERFVQGPMFPAPWANLPFLNYRRDREGERLRPFLDDKLFLTPAHYAAHLSVYYGHLNSPNFDDMVRSRYYTFTDQFFGQYESIFGRQWNYFNRVTRCWLSTWHWMTSIFRFGYNFVDMTVALGSLGYYRFYPYLVAGAFFMARSMARLWIFGLYQLVRLRFRLRTWGTPYLVILISIGVATIFARILAQTVEPAVSLVSYYGILWIMVITFVVLGFYRCMQFFYALWRPKFPYGVRTAQEIATYNRTMVAELENHLDTPWWSFFWVFAGFIVFGVNTGPFSVEGSFTGSFPHKNSQHYHLMSHVWPYFNAPAGFDNFTLVLRQVGIERSDPTTAEMETGYPLFWSLQDYFSGFRPAFVGGFVLPVDVRNGTAAIMGPEGRKFADLLVRPLHAKFETAAWTTPANDPWWSFRDGTMKQMVKLDWAWWAYRGQVFPTQEIERLFNATPLVFRRWAPSTRNFTPNQELSRLLLRPALSRYYFHYGWGLRQSALAQEGLGTVFSPSLRPVADYHHWTTTNWVHREATAQYLATRFHGVDSLPIVGPHYHLWPAYLDLTLGTDAPSAHRRILPMHRLPDRWRYLHGPAYWFSNNVNYRLDSPANRMGHYSIFYQMENDSTFSPAIDSNWSGDITAEILLGPDVENPLDDSVIGLPETWADLDKAVHKGLKEKKMLQKLAEPSLRAETAYLEKTKGVPQSLDELWAVPVAEHFAFSFLPPTIEEDEYLNSWLGLTEQPLIDDMDVEWEGLDPEELEATVLLDPDIPDDLLVQYVLGTDLYFDMVDTYSTAQDLLRPDRHEVYYYGDFTDLNDAFFDDDVMDVEVLDPDTLVSWLPEVSPDPFFWDVVPTPFAFDDEAGMDLWDGVLPSYYDWDFDEWNWSIILDGPMQMACGEDVTFWDYLRNPNIIYGDEYDPMTGGLKYDHEPTWFFDFDAEMDNYASDYASISRGNPGDFRFGLPYGGVTLPRMGPADTLPGKRESYAMLKYLKSGDPVSVAMEYGQKAAFEELDRYRGKPAFSAANWRSLIEQSNQGLYDRNVYEVMPFLSAKFFSPTHGFFKDAYTDFHQINAKEGDREFLMENDWIDEFTGFDSNPHSRQYQMFYQFYDDLYGPWFYHMDLDERRQTFVSSYFPYYIPYSRMVFNPMNPEMLDYMYHRYRGANLSPRQLILNRWRYGSDLFSTLPYGVPEEPLNELEQFYSQDMETQLTTQFATNSLTMDTKLFIEEHTLFNKTIQKVLLENDFNAYKRPLPPTLAILPEPKETTADRRRLRKVLGELLEPNPLPKLIRNMRYVPLSREESARMEVKDFKYARRRERQNRLLDKGPAPRGGIQFREREEELYGQILDGPRLPLGSAHKNTYISSSQVLVTNALIPKPKLRHNHSSISPFDISGSGWLDTWLWDTELPVFVTWYFKVVAALAGYFGLMPSQASGSSLTGHGFRDLDGAFTRTWGLEEFFNGSTAIPQELIGQESYNLWSRHLFEWRERSLGRTGIFYHTNLRDHYWSEDLFEIHKALHEGESQRGLDLLKKNDPMFNYLDDKLRIEPQDAADLLIFHYPNFREFYVNHRWFRADIWNPLPFLALRWKDWNAMQKRIAMEGPLQPSPLAPRVQAYADYLLTVGQGLARATGLESFGTGLANFYKDGQARVIPWDEPRNDGRIRERDVILSYLNLTLGQRPGWHIGAYPLQSLMAADARPQFAEGFFKNPWSMVGPSSLRSPRAISALTVDEPFTLDEAQQRANRLHFLKLRLRRSRGLTVDQSHFLRWSDGAMHFDHQPFFNLYTAHNRMGVLDRWRLNVMWDESFLYGAFGGHFLTTFQLIVENLLAILWLLQHGLLYTKIVNFFSLFSLYVDFDCFTAIISSL